MLLRSNFSRVNKIPKVKLAVTVALIKAFLSSSLVKSPSPFAKLAAIVPAKESPQPVHLPLGLWDMQAVKL